MIREGESWTQFSLVLSFKVARQGSQKHFGVMQATFSESSKTWKLSPSFSIFKIIPTYRTLPTLLSKSEKAPDVILSSYEAGCQPIKDEGQKRAKTINSRYSLVVTHPTTNLPAHGLSTAERTGSPVFHVLWSIAYGIADNLLI